MASFFQPGSNDLSIADCDTHKFEVYCNSLIPSDRLLQTWYQKFNLILGGVAVFIPLVYMIVRLAIRLPSPRSLRFPRLKSSKESQTKIRKPPPSLVGSKAVKSFQLHDDSDGISDPGDPEYGLLTLPVMPITIDHNHGSESGSRVSQAPSASSYNKGASVKMDLVCVDMTSFSPNALDDSRISKTAQHLADLSAQTTSAGGIALRCDVIRPISQINKLLELSSSHQASINTTNTTTTTGATGATSTPILFLCNHDDSETIWNSLNLTSLAGIIIQNACILQNGLRRDYFRAKTLRKIMARCAKERESRPEFFVGFLDLWDTRPHPAVVRRAVKLAEHFGAVMEHGSRDCAPVGDGGVEGVVRCGSAGRTLSGFEFLRNGAIIELQKLWSTETKKVWIPNNSKDQIPPSVSSLPLNQLEPVIPEISRLFDHHTTTLPTELETIRTEKPRRLAPPQYNDHLAAVPRGGRGGGNLWDLSGDGEKLSTRGCFPITTEPTAIHYDAVVNAQQHLKELQMLQPLKTAESSYLLTAYRRLVKSYGNCHYLVQTLIDGIESCQISIFKGLDTGFGVPDSACHFWAVSRALDQDTRLSFDIFLSLKTPNDATTILHTWLAHHGVSRSERFEIELQLEIANSINDSKALGLPLSIKTAIDRSSHAETLGLLHQIQVSNLTVDHSLRDPLVRYARSTLIEDTTRFSWYANVSQKSLDGSVEFREILRQRLVYFAQRGARCLPSLDSLTKLHRSVCEIVEDALFFGNREPLNIMVNALLQTWEAHGETQDQQHIDINADFFALIFFTTLRRAAFEDVYMEATDRCPFFLSQPDQAAVFSELWILGSQCEIYFGILPRSLGEIVYNRYKAFLEANPPGVDARSGNEIMSMYANNADDDAETTSPTDPSSSSRKSKSWRKLFTDLGAISIFCLPAIMDVFLLTFVGRGFFMTAFMRTEHLQAAGLALLISLLLTAGVTGWVGSVGNYYLINYAYDNMIYFHVQRLSGGFVLTLIIAMCGLIGYSVEYDVGTGFVFVGYVIGIATYFNLLGVMATMHQQGDDSPMTSGRTVLWRTIPFLTISPILSSFINGYDLEIYLPVMYIFLFLLLLQYRRLCHEWSDWLSNIPKFTEEDVVKWYKSKAAATEDNNNNHNDKSAQAALRQAVAAHQNNLKHPLQDRRRAEKKFVSEISLAMPYINWLFKQTVPNGKVPDPFSASWFTQLGESLKQQKQLARGLKEHNVLILFRFARYDIGQNLGLFLVALMDRWVSIVMGGRNPRPNIYVDSRARYGICFSILYFCASVMVLDATLQKYWDTRFKLSKEKLTSHEHAQTVAKAWEHRRMTKLARGLRDLLIRLMFVLGVCTLLFWILVENPQTVILYYCYILGYSCVIIFQFNRCFTTNVRAHITIILSSAAIGFLVGCILRAVPSTASWLYCEILAQNVSAVLAALGTFAWNLKDWTTPSQQDSSLDTNNPDSQDCIFLQTKIGLDIDHDSKPTPSQARVIRGKPMVHGDSSVVDKEIVQLLQNSLQTPNNFSLAASWSSHLLQTTLTMWTEQRIRLTIVSRQQLINHGLGDHWSFSIKNTTDNILEITVGFLADQELRKTSWQSLLASLTTGSLLYHVSRAQLALSHSKAVRAEHFLHGTKLLSQRIDFELSFEDEATTTRIRRKTSTKLVKHLCLGVPIDSKWELLPQSSRETIVRRITGEKFSASHEFMQWVVESDIDMSTADFHINLTLNIALKADERAHALVPFSELHSASKLPPAELKPVKMNPSGAPASLLQHWLRAPVIIPLTIVKWIAIISGAGSDIERELWYCLRNVHFNKTILWFLLLLWRICRTIKDLWIYTLLIYGKSSLVAITRMAQKGARRKLKGDSIIVELPRKTITGFALVDDTGSMALEAYDGIVKQMPLEKEPLFRAVYDDQFRLRSRIDDGTRTSTYSYPPNPKLRWPLSKEVSDGDFRTVVFYDKYGRISRGTMTIDKREFAFQYHYKATPAGSTDVLSGDFKLVQDPSCNILSVFWGASLPERLDEYDWVPSERICRLVKVIEGKIYVTDAEYRHRRDPLLTSFLREEDGRKTAIAEAPKIFSEEHLFIARPNNLSFDLDDLLVYHSKQHIEQMKKHGASGNKRPSLLSRLNLFAFPGRIIYRRLPTWRIRTELWNEWLKADCMDALTACWMDELILREEPLLSQYWNARDTGRLQTAFTALDNSVHQIVSAIDLSTDISEVCLLPIRTADLYSMGLGKDATQVTTRPEDCFNDTNERISIIFNDIGCWPESPGGVSNCRRDLVNGHSTIRNHVLAECANDYGIPRFQVEKNVQSMKLLPLWGLDGKSAHHGLIDNLLQSQVDERIRDTHVQRDIIDVFIPLLKEFVRGARTRHYSRADLIRYSNVMLSMSKYYEQKDYSRTWESKQVEKAWVDAWLMPYNDDPNIIDPSKCFELERPSMSDFKEALGIYLAYFFIFSVRIPERCPRVFQSTHHGISSLFGMVLRYRRGVTFGIWDHAILWRECCLNLSPAQSELPVSVQSMLLSGIGLATRLAYLHADVILPCTSLFNPMWEADIGTDRGRLGSKQAFNRRIDPIVNGISDMESFTPVDKVRTSKPTVVMLSNVQFIKGIKTAILAADIIINRWGFEDYRLVVYGAKDRQPSYALEMAKLIVENGLSDNVTLAGFGKPKEVLKDAWLFMNSSISEGLPLAIGEAALAGVPIVATEVGATALVMTDPEDQEKRYGEVVPPNDPLALARSQINILSMVGPWAKYTEDESRITLPDEIKPSDVGWLTDRMYKKADYRRRLGLLSREVVLHSFHGNRYLREHEQMYWIQWHLAKMRENPVLRNAAAAGRFKFGAVPALRYADPDEVDDSSVLVQGAHNEEEWKKKSGRRSRIRKASLSFLRWQDFVSDDGGRLKKGQKQQKETKNKNNKGGMHNQQASVSFV